MGSARQAGETETTRRCEELHSNQCVCMHVAAQTPPCTCLHTYVLQKAVPGPQAKRRPKTPVHHPPVTRGSTAGALARPQGRAALFHLEHSRPAGAYVYKQKFRQQHERLRVTGGSTTPTQHRLSLMPPPRPATRGSAAEGGGRAARVPGLPAPCRQPACRLASSQRGQVRPLGVPPTRPPAPPLPAPLTGGARYDRHHVSTATAGQDPQSCTRPIGPRLPAHHHH